MGDGPREHLADRFHAAVDLGASSGRVMLGRWGSAGLELIEVRRFSNGPVAADGRLVWDVARLFDETLLGLAAAVEFARSAGSALSGIGVDSWGVDVAVVPAVDSAAEIDPSMPLPSVRHHRGADPLGPASAAEVVDGETAYAVTGVLEQAINTSYQLRTLAAEGVGTNASGPPTTVLLVPDLWVYLLTGVQGAERTIASTTQLLDRRSDDWSTELIARWGIDAHEFPAIVGPGTVAGRTTPAMTDRLGARAPIPVYRVAEHDTASALAFARPDGSELLVSSGSWSLAGVCLPAPMLTEQARLAGFTNEAGAGGTSLLLRNLAGMWLLTECARGWAAEDGRPVDPVELVAEAARVDAADDAAQPPVFDVGDLGLLAPGDMPSRVAALCVAAGQPAPVGRTAVVRSVVESLAAAYAETARACAAITGIPLRSVRIVGGGSRNDLLCHRTAELTGLPVTAGPAEASAIGNLAVQLVAAGRASSAAEVFATVATPDARPRHHETEQG